MTVPPSGGVNLTSDPSSVFSSVIGELGLPMLQQLNNVSGQQHMVVFPNTWLTTCNGLKIAQWRISICVFGRLSGTIFNLNETTWEWCYKKLTHGTEAKYAK